MLSPGLLIASNQDSEYADLEEKILLHNKAFGDLPEEKRRFVVYYLLVYPKKGMAAVAEATGLSKAFCYELAKEPGLMALMISAAQAISGLGDLRCSVALDMLADEMCHRIARGNLRAEEITPTMLRILEAGKTRLGLNPAALNALRVSMTDKEGNRTELAVASLDNADQVLSKLRERQQTSDPGQFEAEFVEVVHSEAQRLVEEPQPSKNFESAAAEFANLQDPAKVKP
jgi:hypothetical protein